jgi:hypothetical protein
MAERYQADNREAGTIIHRDAVRYGRDAAGLVLWARLVLSGVAIERDWRLSA